MNYKSPRGPSLKTIMAIVLWPVMLVACVTTANPPTMTHDVATLTVTETHTPTPLVPASFLVEDVTAQYRDSFQMGPAFSNLPNGTYLIAKDLLDGVDRLLYYTPDGSHTGIIGSFLNIALPFDDVRVGDYRLSPTTDHPVLLALFSSVYSDDYPDDPQHSKIGSGKSIIWIIDLLSGETKVWLATIRVDEEMACSGTFLSPDFRWLAGSCWKQGENYIYLADLSTGTGRYLYSAENPCRTSSAGYDKGWAVIVWPQGSGSLESGCFNGAEEAVMTCTVSLPAGQFSCRKPNHDQNDLSFMSRSPDGTKVAVWVRPNGQEQESYWFLTDWACTEDAQACPEYLRAPIGNGSYDSYVVSMTWDSTGRYLVSTHFPLLPGSDPPYGTIDVADLQTMTVSTFSGPPESSVADISPDSRWMVLQSMDISYGLMLLSLNGQVLRRLPQLGDYPAHFLGWLVIP